MTEETAQERMEASGPRSRSTIDSTGPSPKTPPMCRSCGEHRAQICDECRRASALKWFSGISRHPESIEKDDVVCLVCEDGPASWCGLCWATAVADYRKSLREETGRHIGLWPDYPDSKHADTLLQQTSRDAQEIARLRADLERRDQGGPSHR